MPDSPAPDDALLPADDLPPEPALSDEDRAAALLLEGEVPSPPRPAPEAEPEPEADTGVPAEAMFPIIRVREIGGRYRALRLDADGVTLTAAEAPPAEPDDDPAGRRPTVTFRAGWDEIAAAEVTPEASGQARVRFRRGAQEHDSTVPVAQCRNVLLALAGKLPDRSRSTVVPPDEQPAPPKPPRRGRAGRKPYRSRVLGAVLKLIGLCVLGGMFAFVMSDAWDRLWASSKFLCFFLPPFAYGVGAVLIYRGYQLGARTFDPGKHPDDRPPILYLRGFDTDGRRTLQPETFLARVHGVKPVWRHKENRKGWWNRDMTELVKDLTQSGYLHPLRLLRMLLNAGADTVAEVFAIGFRRLGPLVAIGRPGDALATPGPDQMYVPDEKWQQVVLDYLGRSQAVILMPSNSPGVQWEIDQVFARVPRHRVLLDMREFRGDPNGYEQFRARVAGRGVRLPEIIPVWDRHGFVYFEPDGTPRVQALCLKSPVLWPLTGNAVDTRRTFGSYIQGLAGGDRPPPARPRAYPGHTAASLVVTTVMALFPLAVLNANTVYADMAWRYASAGVSGTPLARVVPEDDPTGPAARAYTGTRMPYEFRLGPAWVPKTTSAGTNAVEYLFSYWDGLAEIAINVVETPFPNDAAVVSYYRTVVEETARRQRPGMNAVVTHTDPITVRENGAVWLAVEFTITGGGGTGYNHVRAWRTPHATLFAEVAVPSGGTYKTFADRFFSTLRVTGPAPTPVVIPPPTLPPTPIGNPPAWEPKLVVNPPPPTPVASDPVAEVLAAANAGRPAKYDGKAMGYTLTLPGVWRAEPIPAAVEQNVRRAAGDAKVQVHALDHHFLLRDSSFGALGTEVIEGEFDHADLPGVVAEQERIQRELLRAAVGVTGPALELRVVGSRTFTAGSRDWSEYEFRVTAPGRNEGFTLLNRITTYRGKTLIVTGRVQHFDPRVRRLVVEALDAVTITRTPPPGADLPWAGKTVIPTRFDVLARPRPPIPGKAAEPLRDGSYTVLADDGGRLKVRDGGRDVWFDKDDAVPLEHAVGYFTDRLAADPKSAPARFGRAVARDLRGEPEAAIDDYGGVIELDPNNAGAYGNRGDLRRRLRRFAPAAEDYTAAIRLAPTDAANHDFRGLCYLELRDYPKAAADYTEAIRLGRRLPHVVNNRGLAREQLGDLPAAAADLAEAVRLDPGFVNAWRSLGRVNAARGLAADAVANYSEAIRLDAGHADTFYRRSALHRGRRDFGLAAADLSAALRIAPDLAPALRDKAWLLATCPDPAVRDGKAAVAAALKLVGAGKRPGDLAVLAAAHAEAADFPAAVRAQRQALADREYAAAAGKAGADRLALYEDGKAYREP
ncbi:tetratricopeptide repeat protein [Urbifossiella limnaea]|uniref:Tetratricopeptide repeat protein n=1 Tax=Urbifossiella limnaea TaxID=2528023 RepID=A0A517XN55_9BACT|nr:tetratricopeptide repeat protein [Urbifossiella limnaea]QDU18940.1 Tetratricopeptide repeat protein [Urbifossiella limnaea]